MARARALGPLGPLDFKCSQHSPTTRPSVESTAVKAFLLSDRVSLSSAEARLEGIKGDSPHLTGPEGCAVLRIVLATVPRICRFCEHFPDGFDLHPLPLARTPLCHIQVLLFSLFSLR